MVVVSHIIRTLNIKTFGIFCKWPSVIISLLLFIAQTAHTTAAFDKQIVY
jgi:hypothetical protein